MSRFISDKIIPYTGIESFHFGMSIDKIRECLKEEKIHFNQSEDSHKGCTPDIPWTFIGINDSITLCFVKGILFEIVLENSSINPDLT